VLIQQFRPGVIAAPASVQKGEETYSPWLVEIVAGLIEQEEAPAAVAIRETQEEAGCQVLDLQRICRYFVSPGGSNEFLHLFCGRVDASHAGGVHGLDIEHENIRALSLPADEAFTWVREEKIQTSPAIIALQWLQLHREWLRKLWQAK
jgi:ADP-ribose pyrophosphatase